MEISVAELADIYIEEGVLFINAKSSFKMTLKIAQKLVEERIRICNGHSYPTCFDMCKVEVFSKEAREYLHTMSAVQITASVFIANNYFSRVFLNSYLCLYSPEVPTKILMNKDEAKKWLKQFSMS